MLRKVPKHITLILNETETIVLLELSSSIVPKDTEESEKVIADNTLYEYLTSTKGRYRKTTNIGVQTLPLLVKTRHCEPEKYEFRDNSTFASNWEMYDTYNMQKKHKIATTEEDEEETNILETELVIKETNEHKLIDEISLKELRKPKEMKDLEKLENNNRYFDAVLVIERLLANNCYNEQQKVFKGILETEECEEIVFNYKLELLWTFTNDDTKSRCVTGISLNNFCKDIVAVGYGKYYFKDRKSSGVIMIWNIKNPKQPEREYYFRQSVTSLAFSNQHQFHLAVGLYNGNIHIIDVSKRDLEIVGEDCSISFEPAWNIAWFQQSNQKYFLVCFGDGRVCKYQVTRTKLTCEEVMRVEKGEGNLKGLEYLHSLEEDRISNSRFVSTNCLSMISEDETKYFVATSEGVIHKCRTDSCTQHLSMFKAHEGFIHAVKFSPFVNNIFVTCGDDFQKCIWVQGVDEPLITSRFCMEPVLDVEWSPSHSTLLASLRGNDIILWDLQRKIYLPQSKTKSPTNSKNTVCRFTPCGRSLLVGDVDGNVHVFSLSGLPMRAFFQENLFFQSLKRLLLTNEHLTTKLERLGVFGKNCEF